MSASHRKVTGFSGNEIYCLSRLSYEAGQLCLGNNVLALGIVKSIGAGLSNLGGGEVTEITNLVRDGRRNAYERMIAEAKADGGVGIAGVSFDIVSHGANLEFIALGSTIHRNDGSAQTLEFSTSADAQALYCQVDAGFTPRSFVFSNVAYSIGVSGNIGGMFRGLGRGEVPQYTEIFDKTRHLTLTRIQNEAKAVGANAVIGIETSIMPLLGAQEMMMMGTASSHPLLVQYADAPITSDLRNEELWNLVNIGYMPVQLVLGVSVYSLGLTSSISSSIKSFFGGQVDSLTDLLYEAREKALERIQRDAERCNADKVVGVKTRIYDLGGGLVEFMVIGTAVRKIDGLTTRTAVLPAQAIIQDKETFIESYTSSGGAAMTTNTVGANRMQTVPFKSIFTVIFVVFYVLLHFLSGRH